MCEFYVKILPVNFCENYPKDLVRIDVKISIMWKLSKSFKLVINLRENSPKD